MITNHESEVFQTIIPLKTHVEAKKFASHQSQANKARQVYLNTLAVSTVSLYLNSIGWSTNLEHSDSQSLVLQTMMDVADLYIPGYGKLECRFIFKGENVVTIPPEVWSERIGYIVVELEESLKYASVIGFVRRVSQASLPLNRLEPLVEFPGYLSQQKRMAIAPPANLHQWFCNRDRDRNWRHLEELFSSTNTVFNFRSPQKLASKTSDRLSLEAQRVKLVSLGETPDFSIALLLNIRPKNEREFDISLMVCNSETDKFLPKGLEMVVADGNSCPVMIAQASETETIEFCFSGHLGEHFSIELSLDEEIRIESFII